MIDQQTTIDADYKDATPLDTVQRIRQILDQCGIVTTEDWADEEVPHCYSLRLSIEGTLVGTNGKGVTRPFAQASAYGEFMERLQLGNIWKNKMNFEKNVSASAAQSRYVSAEALLERNNGWYQLFAQLLENVTGVSMTPRQILDQHTEKDGTVLATPYYSVHTGTVEYLPLYIGQSVYGSNGGAAGNSIEEAIVQAISEIVERNHQLRIIDDQIAVPTIPETVLQNCPLAYKTIGFLREQGFRVVVKDCSLGTRFPVVCVCIIETATGKYHTHFGAHPNFEVALQRTLTETFQGRNLKNVADFDNFCYQHVDTRDYRRLLSELMLGASEKMPGFFLNEPEGEYHTIAGFAGMNNRECLAECIAFFKELGYDVLVRDCSCLGFPTCQVIIPGYSEVLPHRFSNKFNAYRYQQQAARTLRNPTTASVSDMLGLLLHLEESGHRRLWGFDRFQVEASLPSKLSGDESTYYTNAALAYTCYSLGRHADTITYINNLLHTQACTRKGYLICLKRYLSMVQNQFSAEEIRKTLTFFHDEETVSYLYSFLDTQRNPLYDLVLRCDELCSEACPLRAVCKKKDTNRIGSIVIEKSKLLDQAELAQVFAGL